MNPVSASPPTQTASAPADSGLTPSIVSNIPVYSPGAAAASVPEKDDEELDKIMQDVNHDIKQADEKPSKHHFFGHKHKSEANFSAQPRSVTDIHTPPVLAQAAQPVSKPPSPRAQAPAAAAQAPVRHAQPRPHAQAKPQPAKVKPEKTNSGPVGAILLTIIVTAGLTAAAIYAYK
jgi:hypothetical protein